MLTSTFLEEDAASSGRPLAAVLLNWTLPSLAARVWQRGEVVHLFQQMAWLRPQATIDVRHLLPCVVAATAFRALEHRCRLQPSSMHGGCPCSSMHTCPWRPCSPQHCHPPCYPPCTATLRICADGGANRLYDELRGPSHASDSVPMPHPHAIIGDLDSIRPEVAAYYRDAGVAITDLSHDQDSTDLQKCVEYAAAHGSRPQHIVAFGERRWLDGVHRCIPGAASMFAGLECFCRRRVGRGGAACC